MYDLFKCLNKLSINQSINKSIFRHTKLILYNLLTLYYI